MGRTKKEHNDLGVKIINNIKFTAHEYIKKLRKYRVTAEGYEGERLYGCDTWEKHCDGDVTDGRSSFSPKNKRWFQTDFKKNENVISSLLPTVYTPIQKNFIGVTLPESFDRMIDELGCIESIKGVRLWFKKYAKYYHPDFLGRELFLDEQITYDILVETRDAAIDEIKMLEELFEN